MVLSIGVNQSQQTVCNWENTHGLTHPVLSDPSGAVYDQYGDNYVPYNVVLDGDMIVRFTDSGFDEPEIITVIETYLAQLLRITHVPHPDTEDSLNPYLISADITSYYQLIPDQLRLYWNLDGGTTFTQVQLTQASGNTYQAEIPAQPAGTTVYYYLSAADAHGSQTVDPPSAPDDPHSFYVGADITPPAIAHTPLSDQPLDLWPMLLRSSVTDNLGIAAVAIEFNINGGDIQTAPMSLVSGSLYEGTFFGSVTIGDQVNYRIRATDAAASPNTSVLPTSGFYTFTIIDRIPVYIYDADETPISGAAIRSILDNWGIAYQSGGALPDNCSMYQAIFVCLGIYSTNHVLTQAEGQALASFLDNGGRLFMEGGDTWYYDAETAVHPYFHIGATSDGAGDISMVQGMAGAFTEGMSFTYSGNNNYIDRLVVEGGSTVIFRNSSPGYNLAISYDSGTYKTIGTAFEFGGLNDGLLPNRKEELLRRIMDYFGISTTPDTPTPTLSPTPTATPDVTSTPEPTPPPPTDTPAPTPEPPTPEPTDTPPPPTPTAPPATDTPTVTPTNPPPPTETPVPTDVPPTGTPEPEPSPTPIGDLAIILTLNQQVFRANDHFLLSCTTVNPDAPLPTHQYILLDVWGQYWFWPGWQQTLDFTAKDVPTGSTSEYILDFTWPAGAGNAEDIGLWAGLLDESDTGLLCDVSHVTFDFE